MLKTALIFVLTIAIPTLAVQTSHWTHTNEADFKNGTLENVVATNFGDLKLSRAVKTLLEQDAKLSAVYALAAGKDGTIYAGTGPQGVVLQINGDTVKELVKLDEVTNVFSLIVDKDGAILIGTGGESGKILRIAKPGDKPKEIFSAEGVQYIWCMVQTPDGKIYAGTGPTGQLYEVNGDGSHSVVLDTEENNLLCMTSDGKDLLYVGTDPDGLVYRVNRKTKEAYVVHDAPESEIGALALDDKGNLYAGTAEAMEQTPGGETGGAASERIGRPDGGGAGGVPIPAPARPEPKPPEMPDPNPGEPDPIPKGKGKSNDKGKISSADSIGLRRAMFLDALTTKSSSTTKPKKQADERGPMPPGGHPSTEPASGGLPAMLPPSGIVPRAETGTPREGGNAIYKIDKEGLVREIFRQPALVISMIINDGTLLVGTGSEGQVYQINPEQEETIALAKVEAKQVMAMLPVKGRIILGLANTGAISAMTEGFALEGTYTSATLDAQQVSRFGKIQLHGSLPQGTTLKVQTRSGNISEPNDTFWSKWTEAAPAQEFLEVTAPPARFLQYRFTFTSGDGTKTPVVDDVNVSYQLPNLAPVIKSVKGSSAGKAAGAANSADANAAATALATPATPTETGGKETITWEASDPNNDELVYSLYYRSGSRSPWILLKDKLKESTFDWDTRTASDGRYELKVVASDDLANPPGMGRETTRVSDPVMVDNTPPLIAGMKATGGAGDVRVQFSASDRTSTLSGFAYTVDSSEQWQTVLPSDKIADSPDENVNFTVSGLKSGVHQVAVKAVDAKGNQAIATLNVTVDAPAKP
ncbi:MAG TPA: hypothetical protein VF669_19205 [Tepidisphaeraceae bacterium]|jgi:hypothetical protein